MFKNKMGAYALALAIAAAALTGCGAGNGSVNTPASTAAAADTAAPAGGEPFSVVCTIFPAYDWTREILGSHADEAQVTYLLDNGVDLHSYQPTMDDMMKISDCDLFIYVGGESDEWVEDALEDAQNRDMRVISLLDVLGDSAKVEELKEGMQEEDHDLDHDDDDHEDDHDEDEHDDDDHEDDHDEDEHDDDDHDKHDHDEEEYDEHVWLSLRNARIFCAEIERNMEVIDPANAADYRANLEDYTARLDELDSSFKAVVDSSSARTLIFGDRFPFRYFVDDYGLDYYAAFIGCSAETEASFETVTFLADKVKELDCKTIFILESSDSGIADTIISTSGRSVEIAELNSLQSVSREDIAGGATYISLMQGNCDVLAGALE